MRLDLAHRRAAADVEVVDEDRRGVLDGAHHGVGDRLVRRAERLHEQAHAVGQRARTSGGALGHRGDDLEQRGAGVTGPRRVVEPPQPDRHRHRLGGREIERRQRHRAVEHVAAAPAELRRDRHARLLQGEDVALDRPHTHLEALRQAARTAARRPGRPQLLDERVEPVEPVHPPRLRVGYHTQPVATLPVRQVPATMTA